MMKREPNMKERKERKLKVKKKKKKKKRKRRKKNKGKMKRERKREDRIEAKKKEKTTKSLTAKTVRSRKEKRKLKKKEEIDRKYLWEQEERKQHKRKWKNRKECLGRYESKASSEEGSLTRSQGKRSRVGGILVRNNTASLSIHLSDSPICLLAPVCALVYAFVFGCCNEGRFLHKKEWTLPSSGRNRGSELFATVSRVWSMEGGKGRARWTE